MIVAGGEEGSVRSAVTERHPEALGAADYDVGPEFAGWFEQREGQQVGGDDERAAGGVHAGGEITVVLDATIRRGILHEGAEERGVERGVTPWSGDDVESERLGARAEEGDGLRMDVVRHEKLGAGAFDPMGHGHGFGRGGGFVEERGVRNFHTGQVGDHGLEIEESFETSLGEFGLIRRVGGIPTWILEDVAQDDRRGVAVVVAHAEVGGLRFVLRGEGADFGQGGVLVERGRQVERFAAADDFRDGGVDERVEGGAADGLEHARDLRVVGSDMTTDKRGMLCGGGAHTGQLSRFARGSRRGI